MNRRKTFGDYVPPTFKTSEALPGDKDEAADWQDANISFWNDNPMRYDWNQDIDQREGSARFFEEIDRRFFEEIKAVMPWKDVPFDNLIPFEALKSKKVLEIGVGLGSHAALIAPRVLSYTGIDLTDYAVRMTSQRMRVCRINATIQQMDAENLEFPDDSFDFVWSWGVIHHTSNTKKALEEIYRVLKPGGQAVIMVYHRGWWNYYAVGTIAHGLLRGGFLKYGSLARVVQASTDGALARYYTKHSLRNLARGLFSVEGLSITGNKADVLPIPGGRIKKAIIQLIPDSIVRILLSQFRMGSLLIAKLREE